MKHQSDLEHLVTTALVDHYQANSPGLIQVVKQLLGEGLDPAMIEAIVQQHCPSGSAVAAHAYLLATHYKTTTTVGSESYFNPLT